MAIQTIAYKLDIKKDKLTSILRELEVNDNFIVVESKLNNEL
jgi:hypothetical protein